MFAGTRELVLLALGLGASTAACSGALGSSSSAAGAEIASVSAGLSPLAKVSTAIGADNVLGVQLVWEALPGGFARAVAASRRAGRAAFASERTLHLYQLDNGVEVTTLEPCAEVVRGAIFFYENTLIVVCRDGVRRYDAFEGKRLAPLKAQAELITAAHLSQQKLALGQRDGVIRVHDLASERVQEVVVPGPPIDVKSLALDAAAERLAVAWVQGSIWWWRPSAPGVPHELVRHEHESDTLAFAPDGTLAEEGAGGLTTLWSLAEAGASTKRGELKNGAWLKRLWFTRDSLWLVRGGADGLELADVSGSRRLVLDAAGQVEDVAMDEAGTTIVSGDRAGRLMLFAASPAGRQRRPTP